MIFCQMHMCDSSQLKESSEYNIAAFAGVANWSEN